MFNSVVLGVVIGLVFVYLLYSLLATIIHEIIATMFSMRARNLEKAITRMLEDGSQQTAMVQAFYNHPIIKFLGEDEKNKNKPSYIKAETFSKVMIDLLKGNREGTYDLDADVKALIGESISKGEIYWKSKDVSNGVRKIEEETWLYLQSAWADAQGDIDKFKAQLESWFNETMDRASGWYKKQTQKVLFAIGIVLAAFFNVNTIDIARKLEKDPELRAQVIAAADAFVKAHPNLDQELESEKQENATLIMNDSIARYNAAAARKDTVALRKDSAGIADYDKRIARLDSISDNEYEKVKLRRDSLMMQAGELIRNDIGSINNSLALGWTNVKQNAEWRSWSFFVFSLIGWTITALAISLGAPFWFDLLNKLMKLRSSVASNDPPAKKNEPKQAPVDRKG